MKKLSLITASILLGASSLMAITSDDLNACKGCHGQNFEKKALGVSQSVKDMSKEDIEKSLIGYKEGTYGKSMKNVMKSQVSKYSEEELKEMSKIIYELNHKEPSIKTGLPDIEKPEVKKPSVVDNKVKQEDIDTILKIIGAPRQAIIFDEIVDSVVPGYKEIRLHTIQNPMKHIVYKDSNGNYIFGEIFSKDGKNYTKITDAKINKEVREEMRKQQLEQEKQMKPIRKSTFEKVVNGDLKELAVHVKGFKADGETLVVFSDPKCPFCIQFEEKLLPRLTKDYKDIYIVQFPLSRIKGHETSLDRSIWALTRDDKRDGMKLLEEATHKPYEEIKKDLENLGEEKYNEIKDKIEKMKRSNLGIMGTPTIIDKEGNSIINELAAKYGM